MDILEHMHVGVFCILISATCLFTAFAAYEVYDAAITEETIAHTCDVRTIVTKQTKGKKNRYYIESYGCGERCGWRKIRNFKDLDTAVGVCHKTRQ